MKSLLSFSLLLGGLMCLTSCNQKATYEVPVIADQHISFTIDGQPMVLSSVSEWGADYNALHISDVSNTLSLSRNSSDLTTTFYISAENLPLELKSGGVVILRDEFVPAIINVLSAEMTGSIYCPHTIDGTGQSIQYEGMVKVEEFTSDGRMKGSFKSDPSATDNAVTITDGTFELIVPIR